VITFPHWQSSRSGDPVSVLFRFVRPSANLARGSRTTDADDTGLLIEVAVVPAPGEDTDPLIEGAVVPASGEDTDLLIEAAVVPAPRWKRTDSARTPTRSSRWQSARDQMAPGSPAGRPAMITFPHVQSSPSGDSVSLFME